MAAVRFGVHIPTCIEGMMYPVPFAKPGHPPTALLCARLGYARCGARPMTMQPSAVGFRSRELLRL